MPNFDECPSVEQLKQLAVGQLPDPPAESLEQHLLECDACAQQTAQLHQVDTLLSSMKGAEKTQPEMSAEEEARLERLMGSLSDLHAARVDATILSNPQSQGATSSESDDVTRELSAAWRAPEESDELGRLGGYRILKVLGAGGMGGVFLAQDMQLRRRVALKLMRPRAASAPGAAERFLREARAAAALRHDHIITIYQVGEEAGVPFLAMEYLEGESLDDRLRREPPMPVSDVLRIGREIAEGLAAAHAKGLIHRDIKPANVWLEDHPLESSPHAPREESRGETNVLRVSSVSGAIEPSAHTGLPHAEREGYFRVKLLDFGLARSAEADTHLTSSGMIVGTPSYMAPEQASGETIDARVDLFSLGVVLYRMTTGKLPFPGRTVLEILRSLATATPAAPQSLNPIVPRKLSDLIDRLLAKDRESRPASAREVAKTLSGILQESGEPGGVSPRTLLQSTSTPATATLSTQVRGLTPPGSPTLMPGDERVPPPRNRRIAMALAATSAVLLAAVLFVQTRGGTLKIEAGDGIDASVVKEQVTIRDTVSGKTYEVSVGENSMRPGQYEIVLRDPASGLKISTDRVEIQRGNSTPLRITLQADLASNKPAVDMRTSEIRGWHGWPANAPPPAIAPFEAEQAKQHQQAWATYLNVPVEYTNSIGMKFRLIPSGEFMMGSTPAENEAALKFAVGDKAWQELINSGVPKHKTVLTQPIYLGVNEVTQAEYEKVMGMGKNPSAFAPMGEGKAAVAGTDTTSHPVETVSWNDAAEFCAKLSQQAMLKPFYFRAGETITPLDGTGYRLPTEAEWEFACRGGTTTKYWCGDLAEDLVRVGWFGENCGGRTHAVAEMKANPFGLYDIYGNVNEWVEDLWEPTYYSQFQQKPALNPRGPSSAGTENVLRGGDWCYPASHCRAAFRRAAGPTNRSSNIGFRVTLSVAAVKIGID